MDALTALPHTPEDRAYHTRSIERITSATLTQINSSMAQSPEAEFIVDAYGMAKVDSARPSGSCSMSTPNQGF
jgi:hypothetical protein